MAIIKGAMSYVRFRLSSQFSLGPEHIVEKLRLFKFRPLHDRGVDQEAVGWCSYLNEFDAEKELVVSDILYDEKVILCLRHDALVLPKPLLKALVKKALAHYYEEHKRWPDRTVKNELEQKEIQLLRARVLPKTRIIEAIWDLKSNELRIFCRSKALIDRFLDLFANTFLEKPVHRDMAYEAYYGVQNKDLLNPYSHVPIFAPPVRIDVQ